MDGPNRNPGSDRGAWSVPWAHRATRLCAASPDLFLFGAGIVSPMLSSLPYYLASLTDVTIRTIVVLVLALYMAHDPDTLISGILRLVPDRRREDAKELIEDFTVRLRG